MFERFTDSARQVVVQAQAQALGVSPAPLRAAILDRYRKAS